MPYVVKPARGVGGLDLPGVWSVYSEGDPLVALFTSQLRSACDDFAWAMNHASEERQRHEAWVRWGRGGVVPKDPTPPHWSCVSGNTTSGG